MRLGHNTIHTITNRPIIGYALTSKLNDDIDIKFFGGDSKEVTPVPIPNTEVKLFSADGTAREAEWESRTLPEINYNPGFHS